MHIGSVPNASQGRRPNPERRLIGHRGGGKTSLNEALLFEAGVINRLGRVEDGTTVSDFEGTSTSGRCRSAPRSPRLSTTGARST